MGEGGRGRRAVVRGRAAVSQLPPVEGAAAGGASREAQSVWRGGVGDAVGRCHRVLLAPWGRCNTTEARRTIQSGLMVRNRLTVFPLQTFSLRVSS